MKIVFLMTLFFVALSECVIPGICYANKRGVEFNVGMSWLQVLEKAKAENKYIFIDCVATWCKPCAMMDKEVYSKQAVGEYMSSNYISIKIQIDSTDQDDVFVKSWYKDASDFRRKYRIESVPSYLFFSPDGELVHRGVAYKDSASFMSMVMNAMDSRKQYYTLLREYKNGRRDYLEMEYLANQSLKIGEDRWAKDVSLSYINGYLLRLPDSSLFVDKNIRFIADHLTLNNKRAFNLFYFDHFRIDSIVHNNGYAQAVLDRLITKDVIDPRLRNTSSPDWNNIIKVIARKYGISYADRTVSWAKMKWYSSMQMWRALANVRIAHFEKYGMDTSGFFAKIIINSVCWNEIFLHVSDKEILEKAIGWMKMLVIAENASRELGVHYSHFVDTYANLLYKAGYVQEAFFWEQKAISLDPKNKDKLSTFEKMKNGQPTW